MTQVIKYNTTGEPLYINACKIALIESRDDEKCLVVSKAGSFIVKHPIEEAVAMWESALDSK